ncbi:hypothetical protein EC973_003057 [Apophysomyces ossiformis]|uniref:Uncharacterized protein n=1 Tax=Apophysomyces ossiformis TaxID=679940 RepID=A0A8H7BHM9_9FUNG|nr:hypothetical protein EC973_003057 [Apophysomyces ossiformis]
MREQTLAHWMEQYRGKEALVEEFLETLSVQWHGAHMTVYGTKAIFLERASGPKTVFIHYVKASVELSVDPHDPEAFMSLGKCLAIVMTVKREAIHQHEMHMLLNDAVATNEIQLSKIRTTLKDTREAHRKTHCQSVVMD